MEEQNDGNTNISALKTHVQKFIDERDWQKFQNPKDLAIAISVEAAELLDIFKWRQTEFEKEEVEKEVADVLIYLLSLANVMNIDVTESVLEKIEINKKKYPIDKTPLWEN